MEDALLEQARAWKREFLETHGREPTSDERVAYFVLQGLRLQKDLGDALEAFQWPHLTTTKPI